MKKIELNEEEVTVIVKALENHKFSLSDNIIATKQYPDMQADFNNQLSTIEPIFIKLEHWLYEID